MSYRDLQEALESLEQLQRKLFAYAHAQGAISYDAVTAAPSDSWEPRSITCGILAQAEYDLTVNPDNGELYAFLKEHREELTPAQNRQVEILARQYERYKKIPGDEFVAYQVLLNEADAAWHKAKAENDFPGFAPYLEKIVAYNRKLANWYHPEMKPYDALLNEYEEGMTTEILDGFFANLRQSIVPLLARIQAAPEIEDGFLYQHYPIEKQREFSDYLMDVLGLDRKHCTIGETEHPFTGGYGNRDVRITTHYYENNLVSSMYSVIHEGGHALYELNCDDCYNYTVLSGGVSMGIHESQSRFYENLIGRSPEFVHAIFPFLLQKFPEQLSGVTEEMFYRAVNKVQPGLIRTEADEVCYALHVMVRYEIEKQLMNGTLPVERVPETWNRLYKEYLGVEVPNDREGCLQDSHWSGGSIGYFPSYALGSAYGAQMLSVMLCQSGNLFEEVAKGNLAPVTAWLKEHIHHYAGLKKPGQLFRDACGEFDPGYYTRYLTEKYTKLYGL